MSNPGKSDADTQAARHPRVAFLVNNPGWNDTRVVKTAQVMARSGFRCVVFGCDRSASTVRTLSVNGVNYVVLPLAKGFLASLIASVFPETYVRFRSVPDLITLPDSADATTAERKADHQSPAYRNAHEALIQSTHATAGKANVESQPRLSPVKRFVGMGIRLARFAIAMAGKPVRYFRIRLHPKNSPIGVRLLLGSYLRSFLAVRQYGSFETIYCHELWTLQAGSLLRKFQPSSPKLVYDSHELELHRNNDWSQASNAQRTSVEARYIGDFDFVITVCESIGRFLEDTYGLRNVLVLPNAPLASGLEQPSGLPRLKQLLRLENTALAVYTGRVTTGRGLTQLIRILPTVKNMHLAIVGPRVQAVADEITLLADRESVAERVHFVDAVPAETLVWFISDADLAVVPIENVCLSYYYSLPNKIFEAAMAGLPVLASDLPELSKFIDIHEIGEVLDFNNMEEARLAAERILISDSRQNDPERAAIFTATLSFDQPLQSIIEKLKHAIG